MASSFPIGPTLYQKARKGARRNYVDFPSPAGVGVHGSDQRPSSLPRCSAMLSRRILALSAPYGSMSAELGPSSSATSAMGLSRAARAMSISLFMIATFPVVRLPWGGRRPHETSEPLTGIAPP